MNAGIDRRPRSLLRTLKLFRDASGYDCIGNWTEREARAPHSPRKSTAWARS